MNGDAADEALRLALSGAIPPGVALARLALAGLGASEVAARLDALLAGTAEGSPAAATTLRAMLAAEGGAGLERVRAMAARSGLDHAAPHAGGDPAAAVARLAAAFDAAVAASPEASVAAYSLGDPARLADATAEVAAWLAREGLLGPDRDALDLGCGIGRVAAALAPRLRSVLALDASPGMVAEARARHGAVPNLRFEVAPGTGLAHLPAASRDLVLAVDAWPYLVLAGVSEAHAADAARLLRPGGALAVLNLSYRGDGGAADAADAARWALAHGLSLDVSGARPFALWDGAAYLLRKPPPRR